jgi:hypothetical protein
MNTIPTSLKPMNPMVLNADATKTIRCACSEVIPKLHFFNTVSKTWQCYGCGHLVDLTAAETKKFTFKSNTVLLANYLVSLGYPVVDVVLEVKSPGSQLMAGTVVMIDTNPEQDPKKNRRVLEVLVETFGKQINYQFEAIKCTTKGKRSGGTTYLCDDLMKLGDDIQTQYEIADLAVNTLGLDMSSHPHFDVKELELKIEVADAADRLQDASKALDKYQKGGRKC